MKSGTYQFWKSSHVFLSGHVYWLWHFLTACPLLHFKTFNILLWTYSFFGNSLTNVYPKDLKLHEGSFTIYVNRFLDFFDHLPTKMMTFFKYRKVASSRPGYYSILDPLTIRFPLHKQQLKILGCDTNRDVLQLANLRCLKGKPIHIVEKARRWLKYLAEKL